MSLGNRIFEIRRSKDLTQSQLSRKSGLAISYLSRIENNHIEPSFSTLGKIADALEVNLIDLFGYEPKKKPQDRCPVSLTGSCIMDHVYGSAGRKVKIDPERYSTRQIQLLQLANYLILFGNRKLQDSLQLLFVSFMNSPMVKRDREWLSKLSLLQSRGK